MTSRTCLGFGSSLNRALTFDDRDHHMLDRSRLIKSSKLLQATISFIIRLSSQTLNKENEDLCRDRYIHLPY